jgi:hypothetical protein
MILVSVVDTLLVAAACSVFVCEEREIKNEEVMMRELDT